MRFTDREHGAGPCRYDLTVRRNRNGVSFFVGAGPVVPKVIGEVEGPGLNGEALENRLAGRTEGENTCEAMDFRGASDMDVSKDSLKRLCPAISGRGRGAAVSAVRVAAARHGVGLATDFHSRASEVEGDFCNESFGQGEDGEEVACHDGRRKVYD